MKPVVREFVESPFQLVCDGKGKIYFNAHWIPSVDAEGLIATTEKKKGFLPIGKNPYLKIPIFFR